eukprot:31494-Pelagococcus_subviridis.AAC.11
MNDRTASSAVRTLHDGCQCSGWWLDIERQIFAFVSKRPEGVSSMNDGGLNGCRPRTRCPRGLRWRSATRRCRPRPPPRGSTGRRRGTSLASPARCASPRGSSCCTSPPRRRGGLDRRATRRTTSDDDAARAGLQISRDAM